MALTHSFVNGSEYAIYLDFVNFAFLVVLELIHILLKLLDLFLRSFLLLEGILHGVFELLNQLLLGLNFSTDLSSP